MENKCYVSREQVTLDLKIEMADSVDEARKMQHENRMHYVDSVYLTLDDLKVLSDKVDASVENDDFEWSTIGTL